jgi:hypothetical protein
MDIHRPKAAHSIREFLIEIGTIIFGMVRMQGRAVRHAPAKTVISLVSAVALVACTPSPTDGLSWAYPSSSETAFGKPLGPGPFHMQGSRLTLTRTQIEKLSGPIDWYPEDHSPAPAIV